jgi:hypothetical protein
MLGSHGQSSPICTRTPLGAASRGRCLGGPNLLMQFPAGLDWADSFLTFACSGYTPPSVRSRFNRPLHYPYSWMAV